MNDNMQEKTVVSRRSAKDFMQTHNLKPFDVKITRVKETSFVYTWKLLCLARTNDLVLKKQKGEDQKIRKRELHNLQNKRDKAKLQLASIDKEIGLLTKI